MAKITFREDRCKGCALCVKACPKGIVAMSSSKYNSKGFHIAECVEPDACIGCAFCAQMCPDVVIKVHATPGGSAATPSAGGKKV